MSPPILQVNQVTKTFGGIFALDEVSFDLHEGDILGVIGPNGSGKTTLVNCITGFLGLTSGEVLFRGKVISGKPAHKIADMGITRTFQVMRPYYSLAAYKNLVIPLFSPRAKRTGGWRGGANSVTAIPSASTFSKSWALKGSPMYLIRWLPAFRRVTLNAWSWPAAWP